MSNGYGSLDGWVVFVAQHFKVLKLIVEDGRWFALDMQCRICKGLA